MVEVWWCNSLSLKTMIIWLWLPPLRSKVLRMTSLHLLLGGSDFTYKNYSAIYQVQLYQESIISFVWIYDFFFVIFSELSIMNCSTLLSDQGTFTPEPGPRGVPKKTTSHRNFAMDNRFLFRVISILAKIKKKKNNPFPYEFFNYIWLKVGEHE